VASHPRKSVLKDQLVRALAADLAVRERAYQAAREGATHAEAKPENDKDTRALEQSYLARGEALRLEEQRVALSEVQGMGVEAFEESSPVRLGALVETDEDGEAALFWILPHGGGTRLAGGSVLVVTPKSPVGRALLGARAGDECEVLVAGKPRLVCIVAIS
jgi:transcription elongation GreA/GreB family factor